MKITLITATYNSFPSILEAIRSVSSPTGVELEYLVIDGGSKDQTMEVVNASNLVTQIVSEPDKGIYDALNKGLRLATGDIIGFLHSDDLLASPDTLKNIVAAFNSQGSNNLLQVDGVYGDLVYVGKKDTKKVIRYWKSQPFKPISLRFGWMPAHPAVFMRREVYEKHGLFDLQFKISADYDLMLRIFKDKSLNFVYLPEVITNMRVGGISNRSIKNMIQKSKEDYRAIRKNKIPHPLWVLFVKNISKIPQFFRKH